MRPTTSQSQCPQQRGEDDRLRYDPERLKLLLEQLAVEAGITLLYETELTAAREGEGRVSRSRPEP